MKDSRDQVADKETDVEKFCLVSDGGNLVDGKWTHRFHIIKHKCQGPSENGQRPEEVQYGVPYEG